MFFKNPSGHSPLLALYYYIVALVSAPDFQQDFQQLTLDAQAGDMAGMAIDAISAAVPGLSASVAKAGRKAVSRFIADRVGESGARILNKVGKRGNIISKSTQESGKTITVVGSLKDTRRYIGRSGFNVLEEALKGEKWTRGKNIKWLDEAIERGDEIWAVTNPNKHKALMKEKGLISEFLETVIPYLEQKTGISVKDKFK